jgi:hypothetical protein
MKLAQFARDLGYAVRSTFAVTPKGAAGEERLDAYWTTGEGAAKIRWPEPCAFCRCLDHLGKYVNPDQVKGHCARLEKRATGHRPNVENSRTKHCPC